MALCSRARWQTTKRALAAAIAAASLALSVASLALWARNASASDVYTIWWFRDATHGEAYVNATGTGTAMGFVGQRWYGPTVIYNELTCRAACGAIVVRFVRGERSRSIRPQILARAAQGLRPDTYSLTSSRDPAALARGRQALGSMPGGLNHRIGGPPSPFAIDGWQAGVPLWLIAIASLVPPAMWLRGRRRHRPGRCASCGYDLRATPERCPECGAAATADR